MHSNIDSLDPGSDASNVDTELDFGGRLREARELKGITLKEIASATKISIILFIVRGYVYDISAML